jgi:hypothetical protein
MHIAKLIRRRFPQHADRIIRILVFVLVVGILIGAWFLLVR